jgi:tetratricopeptide (TPR) repeat protein
VAMSFEAKRAIQLFPQQPLLYLFAGIADYQLESYSKAIESLEQGKRFVLQNNALLVQFYSNLGDAYHAQKDFVKSEENYDLALELNPDNSLVLNNYAYYLSLRNENLEKAEKMSARAVELDSLNSANLDTYAWVLYKRGKYAEAEIFVVKAIKNGGSTDGTLLEHYGDILFKLGRKDEAIQKWEIAKELGGYSELLDKKLEEGKLYE